MKFDYVIGNPPYQEETNGAGRQARPVYNLFFDAAESLNPDYISFITPSRWFSGGMGLNKFRDKMMMEHHLIKIIDFTNAKDCFANNSISGGVNYFAWKKSYVGDCQFTNITNGKKTTLHRSLDEFPIVVRYNEAVEIIRKLDLSDNEGIISIASGLMPFGLNTSYRGRAQKDDVDNIKLYASNGVTYICKSEIQKGQEYLDKYHVLISKTSAEHAGEPDKDGKFGVIPSSMKVINPGEACTHSYFLIGNFENREESENLLKYMKTKFVRFLMLLSISGFGLSKLVLNFVPLQDFKVSSDIDWSQSISNIDEQLYNKYGLTQEEQDFIEAHIKEMA